MADVTQNNSVKANISRSQTTVTIYASATDGEVGYVGASTWAEAKDAVAGNIWFGDTVLNTIQANLAAGSYEIKRYFGFFDTSFIPSSGDILSASLRIYTDSKLGSERLYIVSHAASVVNSSAYNDVDLSGTSQIFSVTTDDTTTTTALTSTSINAFINKGSTTKIALVGANDFNNTAPSTASFEGIASGEWSDVERRPALIITYTYEPTKISSVKANISIRQTNNNSVKAALLGNTYSLAKANIRVNNYKPPWSSRDWYYFLISQGASSPTVVSQPNPMGRSLRFDGGADSYLEYNTSPDVQDTGLWSIIFRFKPAFLDGTTARGIVSKRTGVGTNQAFSFFTWTGNKLFVDIAGNTDRFSSNETLVANKWYTGVCNFNGYLAANQRATLYLNGNLDTTATINTTAIPNFNSSVFFGKLDGTATGRFIGNIGPTTILKNAVWTDEQSRMISAGHAMEFDGANIIFQLNEFTLTSGNSRLWEFDTVQDHWLRYILGLEGVLPDSTGLDELSVYLGTKSDLILQNP